MKIHKLGISIVILLLACGLCYAQNFTLFGGLAMPQGDFGDDSGAGAGLAKTGFGAGFEYASMISPPNLYFVVTAACLLNSVDVDELFDDDEDVEVGRWMNIPIMAGLKFQTKTSPSMSIYGMGLVGYDLLKGPSITYEDETDEVETTSNMAGAMGYGFGGGLVLNERFNIGFRYLGLGEHKLEYTTELNGEELGETKGKQEVSVFLITAGINF